MKNNQVPSTAQNEPSAQGEDAPIEVGTSDGQKPTGYSVMALVHELQVHQVELKAQNEELVRAQSELESLAARYRDLYDFAPVGYMTLDDTGQILEANLACASLLRVERRNLIRTRFQTFLDSESIDAFKALCATELQSGVHQSQEFELRRSDGGVCPVQAEVISVSADGDGANQLRVALVDITARKQGEQTVQEHFEVLARKLGFLTGELDLERFLKQTLIVLAEQDHAECVAFWFTDIQQETITLHSVNDGGQVLPGSKSGHPFASMPLPLESLDFWNEMRRSRRPLILHDVTQYPQFSMAHTERKPNSERTLLFVPLLLGQDVLGLAVLQSPDRRTYRPEEVAFTQAVAQQVTIAVQMARLGEQARQGAILQERNRMAQEIHDTLAQGFTVILMQLEVVADVLTEAPEQAKVHLERARDMARMSLAAARRSVRALRPSELEHDGLPGALAEIVTRTTRDAGIRPSLDVQGVARPLHGDTETNLLRIAQEALYNIQKHAEAKRIWIELSFESNTVRLSVKDDGKGFDTTESRDTNHFGLQVMMDRAEDIGGVFQLSSRPGHGTQIIVTAPVRAPGEWEI